MKSKGSFDQCYNSQIAVDEGTQLIVATGLTQNAADNSELLEMVQKTESNTKRKPERVLADAGYRGEINFLELEKKKIDGYISLGREGKKASHEPTEKDLASCRMYEKLKTETGRARFRRRSLPPQPLPPRLP